MGNNIGKGNFFNSKRRKVERPSLEQLKKEVEELGYSATGRKYGVSDNSIRKWLKSYKSYECIS
jgi:transposase-like protein